LGTTAIMPALKAISRSSRWPATPAQAIALQYRLRGRIRVGGRLGRVRLVGGADVAYDTGRELLYAAVLVYSVPAMKLIEVRTVRAPIRFPYVPGLLSFREVPALLRVIRRLRHRPDLLLCDAQGIAHPRGIGLASHLGLLAGLPTIGCAKSRLLGEHGAIGALPGDQVPLLHRGRRIGSVLRTRARCRPLFVSPGHRIGFGASVLWVLRCCRGYRLPEPVRQADLLVGRLRRADALPRRSGGAGSL